MIYRLLFLVTVFLGNCTTTIEKETPILSEKANSLKQELENYNPDKGFDEERFDLLKKKANDFIELSENREKELIEKLEKVSKINEKLYKENSELETKANKYDKIVLTFFSIIVCIVIASLVYLFLKFKSVI